MNQSCLPKWDCFYNWKWPGSHVWWKCHQGEIEEDMTEEVRRQSLEKNTFLSVTLLGLGHLIKQWHLHCMHAKLLQLCLTLWVPMECSPPGFSVHGILQARILKWVAMPSSRGSFLPRDWISSSYTAGRFFTTEPQGSPAFALGREKEMIAVLRTPKQALHIY